MIEEVSRKQGRKPIDDIALQMIQRISLKLSSFFHALKNITSSFKILCFYPIHSCYPVPALICYPSNFVCLIASFMST